MWSHSVYLNLRRGPPLERMTRALFWRAWRWRYSGFFPVFFLPREIAFGYYLNGASCLTFDCARLMHVDALMCIWTKKSTNGWSPCCKSGLFGDPQLGGDAKVASLFSQSRKTSVYQYHNIVPTTSRSNSRRACLYGTRGQILHSTRCSHPRAIPALSPDAIRALIA